MVDRVLLAPLVLLEVHLDLAVLVFLEVPAERAMREHLLVVEAEEPLVLEG